MYYTKALEATGDLALKSKLYSKLIIIALKTWGFKDELKLANEVLSSIPKK